MNDDVVKKLEYWAFKLCGKGEQEDAASDVMSEALKEIIKLRDEAERLTRERNEARAEVERLRGDAQAISAIAHTGGTAGLSEHEALVEIRRRTLKAWGGRTSRKALEAKP